MCNVIFLYCSKEGCRVEFLLNYIHGVFTQEALV